MGSRLTEMVMDCHDPVAQAAFWAAVLDYHVVRTEDGQVEIAPWEREPPNLAERVRQAPSVPTLVFVKVPEAKTVKNRLHLDLRPVGCSRGGGGAAARPGGLPSRRGAGRGPLGGPRRPGRQRVLRPGSLATHT